VLVSFATSCNRKKDPWDRRTTQRHSNQQARHHDATSCSPFSHPGDGHGTCSRMDFESSLGRTHHQLNITDSLVPYALLQSSVAFALILIVGSSLEVPAAQVPLCCLLMFPAYTCYYLICSSPDLVLLSIYPTAVRRGWDALLVQHLRPAVAFQSYTKFWQSMT
jgi:hypothetical protein